MKEINEAIKSLEKKYGEGVTLRKSDVSNVKALSTGSYVIDDLFGCGGLPIGRMIEVFGAESSGKTSMCLHFAAQAQKQGKVVVFLDVEQAYDQRYASSIGVDTGKLIVAQPSTLEETFDIIRTFVATNAISLIVVDSVAALIPKRDLEEGALEKDSMAVKARLMSKYLPVVTSEIAKSETTVIFINQTRSNIGVYYGPKDTTPGGKALKFFSSVRLSVTKGTPIKKGEMHIGNTLKIVAKKNKVGFPYKEAEIDLYFGEGIDLILDTLDKAISVEVVSVSGNTYSFKNEKIGVGRAKTRAYLAENKEILEKIRKDIQKKLEHIK